MCVFDYDQPVSILTGDEFKPKEGTTFARQVLDCFISIGRIAHSAFGDIILDMKGIQSDKSHGVGHTDL